MDSNEVVVALLGAGGATFIWTLVRSFLALRDSTETIEDKAIERLERFEADCREQLLAEREWGVFWHRRAGQLQYLLSINGIDVPAPEPSPLPRSEEE